MAFLILYQDPRTHPEEAEDVTTAVLDMHAWVRAMLSRHHNLLTHVMFCIFLVQCWPLNCWLPSLRSGGSTRPGQQAHSYPKGP